MQIRTHRPKIMVPTTIMLTLFASQMSSLSLSMQTMGNTSKIRTLLGMVQHLHNPTVRLILTHEMGRNSKITSKGIKGSTGYGTTGFYSL